MDWQSSEDTMPSAPVTEADARLKAAEIADELDRILATSLFAVNMGEFISFECVCGFHVKRRSSVLSHDDQVICGGCGRHWIYKKLEGDPAYGFVPDGYSFPCLECGETCEFEAHELGEGRARSGTAAAGSNPHLRSERRERRDEERIAHQPGEQEARGEQRQRQRKGEHDPGEGDQAPPPPPVKGLMHAGGAREHGEGAPR